MTRGEIWTVASGPDYAGKPRPAVVLQSDRFNELSSVTICPFTTNAAEAPLFRIVVAPDDENRLRELSRIMIDKVTTVSRSKLGTRIGRLSDEDIVRVNRAVMVFLGLAD